jgi:hypothetical protein
MGVMRVMCRRRGFLCGKVQSAILFRALSARDANFCRCGVRGVQFAEIVRVGYVQFALAVVGVDDSNGGNEEVISTGQVWSSG